MEELVGEPFLSDLFEKLFERLRFVEYMKLFRGKRSIVGLLKKFNNKLKIARAVLDNAEERQISEPDVKEWLDELKHVVLKAEDLLEDLIDEARSKWKRESDSRKTGSRRLCKSIFPSLTEFDRTVHGEIAEILNGLGEVLDKTAVLGLRTGLVARKAGSSRRLSLSVPQGESHVYGRDAEKEEILKLVLSDDEEVWGNGIGVLPIVGVGGVGKTTLAELVYDDNRVKAHGFQLKAWVTVSTDFDLSRIAERILQQLIPKDTCNVNEKDPVKLKVLLMQQAIKGKKMLFVLDDIRDGNNCDKWDLLVSIFSRANKRSKIIVTTRSKNVASFVKTGKVTYELQQVSEADCWKIFADHAFNGDLDADPCLQQVGKEIVEKCGGLPLAIKSMAALLRFERNPSKWDSILRSHVWELGRSQSNNVLPSLWLSYHYLPSCLKQCFAYCSIFPKDSEIQKEELIFLWMAEGFLQSGEKEKRMEDVGEEYIKDLLSRSLFQRSSHDGSMVKMHDLIHDLALFVTGEFGLRFDDNTDLKQLTSKTRHLSHSISVGSKSWTGLSKAKYLRTFIGSHVGNADQLVEHLTQNGKCLRVLSRLTNIWVWRVPDSFCNLKHLRYLNLSGNLFPEIPRSICCLYNLQTLLLANCGRLTRLPTNMGRLINLCHLDTTSSPLKEMPPRMGNLKQLRKLTDFVLSESTGPSIKELGDLQYLGGMLRISGLQNVDGVDDVLKANLKEKANLNELSLQWRHNITDKRGKEILEALQPHANLKKLAIYNYAGSFFPVWVGDSLFSNIVSLHLIDSKFCLLLPPLGQLPSLRELSLKNFNELETIGAEFYGNTSSIAPFQSLETLSFFGMPKLHEWSFIGEDKEPGYFPRLKQLHLSYCCNLTGSLPKCDSMETLEIVWCPNLELPGSYRYVGLRKLEIVSCDSLNSLPLDCFPMLNELVLMECANLESFTWSEGTCFVLQYLSFLRLIGCKNLRSLPENMPSLLPSLSSIEMVGCPNIELLPEGGFPCSLENLFISYCHKLIVNHRHWYLDRLTSLRSLHIAGSGAVLDSFPEAFLPSSLATLILGRFSNLKSLNGSAFQHVTSLDTLSLAHCKELQCLPEEVLSTSLYSLIIEECPLLEHRYRRWEGEGWDKISHIRKIAISGETTSQNQNGLEV